ncbi:hypothetical protein [Neobacillus jeddahensis]|uniref:hypothetical protein n=1 Tax=Neobacillus jeddahensis TaxID=1461580 RepID=UPI00058D63A0|nr:hypothetical protein [Neobacillus jeddahensis]
MKTFDFKSGTKVLVDETRIIIEKSGGKSAMKGLFAGRAMGHMTIKMSALTGVICASGLPTPNDFKINCSVMGYVRSPIYLVPLKV